MTNGKGDKRRPRLVTREVEDANWRRTFGSPDPHRSLEPLPDVEPSASHIATRLKRLSYMKKLLKRKDNNRAR